MSESLFIRSLLLESQLSKNVNIRIHTDSTAGKSMATRFGTSKKTKHVQLRFLFIQELVASGVVSVKKGSGTSNPSDVMTKYITKEVLRCTCIATDDLMAFPETTDSMAHDPKQAYQTRTQERACVPFEW